MLNEDLCISCLEYENALAKVRAFSYSFKAIVWIYGR